jgi:hypothetical protein
MEGRLGASPADGNHHGRDGFALFALLLDRSIENYSLKYEIALVIL